MKLNPQEKELVAIGASVASNCHTCVTYHIGEARKVGVSDEQIKQAVSLVAKVKKVPADKVLKAANDQLKRAQSKSAKKCSAPSACKKL